MSPKYAELPEHPSGPRVSFSQTTSGRWIAQVDPNGFVGYGETAEEALVDAQSEMLKNVNASHDTVAISTAKTIEALNKAHIDNQLKTFEKLNSANGRLLAKTFQFKSALNRVLSHTSHALHEVVNNTNTLAKEVIPGLERGDDESNDVSEIDPNDPLFTAGPIASVDMGDESIDDVLYGSSKGIDDDHHDSA